MSKNKNGLRAATIEQPKRGSSEQEVFNYVKDEALTAAEQFVSGNSRKVNILQINNIDQSPMTGWDIGARDLSHISLASLLEGIYVAYGVENPADNLSKWVYDAKGTVHKATTPTSLGFDIVETRFRYEDSDPAQLLSPQDCGFYALDFVRPST